MSLYSARPTTIRSGLTLKTNYSVQHCSDKHIEEQKDIVKNAQTELHTILTALEVVKSDDEVDSLRDECLRIKEKVDKALVVLKLLYKINAELQYARADVKMGEGEQITIARKRVKWLEDRMAMLCGKNRRLGHAGPRQSHKTYTTAVTFRSDSEDFSEQRALPPIRQKSDFFDDDSLYTPSISESEDLQELQRGQRGMMDTPLSEASSELPTTTGYKQVQEESEESDIEPSPQKSTSASSSERKDTSSGQSEAGDQLGELPSMFQKKEYPQTSSPQPIIISSGIQEEDEDEEEEEEKEEQGEEKVTEEGQDQEDEIVEEVKGQSEEATKVDEKQKQTTQGQEKTFLTEVTTVTNKSRVTIVTPTREDTRQDVPSFVNVTVNERSSSGI